MADAVVQIPTDGSGKKLAAKSWTQGADTVYAQAQVEVDAAGNVVAAPATSTLSNTATSTTSATILASNTARRGATIWNDATTALYVKFGTTASATSCTVKMAADSYFEVPFGYTGKIDAVLASSTGNARVTEVTP